MADQSPFVLVEHPRPHVAVVQMHRPDRLNAMSIELVSELHDALETLSDENDTWVVVLTGSGRAFSSGLDLKDHGIVPNVDGLPVGLSIVGAPGSDAALVAVAKAMEASR